jgi:hypothetical protein
MALGTGAFKTIWAASAVDRENANHVLGGAKKQKKDERTNDRTRC